MQEQTPIAATTVWRKDVRITIESMGSRRKLRRRSNREKELFSLETTISFPRSRSVGTRTFLRRRRT